MSFRRGMVSLIALLLIGSTSSAIAQEPASSQEAKKQRGFQENSAPAVVKVFRLQQVEAEVAMTALTKLLSENVRAAVDQRSNSLIVRGAEEDLKTAEAILLRMDEAESKEIPWRVYKPKFLSVLSLDSSLKKMFPGVIVQPDPRSEKLFFSASESESKKIVEMLDEIDVELKQQARPHEKPQPPEPDVQIRILWLVEKEIQDQGIAVPDRYKGVIDKLVEKTQINGLRTAAQFLVSVNPAEAPEFEAFGSADYETENSGSDCRVMCSGEFTTANTGDQRRLLVRASASDFVLKDERAKTEESVKKDDERTVVDKSALCSLKANIAYVPGRPFVLGMSSIKGKASVFVVEVLSPEAAGPAN